MSPFIYVLTVNGLLFFVSLIFYFFPPKKINNLYGYRTHKTMLNQDIWDFANQLFNKTLLKYAGISFLAALVLAYINPKLMSSWFPMAFLFFTILVCIITTEKSLREEFNEEGERTTKS